MSYFQQLYQNRTSMGGMFGPPPTFGGPASFAYPLSTPNRFPMPGPPQMTHIPMMTTPGTSTGMETSASGAGEALSQPGDLSFQPGSINFNSSYDSKQIDDEVGAYMVKNYKLFSRRMRGRVSITTMEVS